MWSRYVRTCIQKTIGADVLQKYGTDFTCQQVEDTFFNGHLPCYLSKETGLPRGFCSLPLSDQMKIMEHGISIWFSKHWWETTKSGALLQAYCGSSWGGFVPLILFSNENRMVDFPMDQVITALNTTMKSYGWKVGIEEVELVDYFIYFQNLTVGVTELTDHLASCLLSQAITNVTEHAYELQEFNGNPFNASDCDGEIQRPSEK